MPALKQHVTTETEAAGVTIAYVGATLAKWWNGRRKQGEVCTFSGWYWFRKGEEGGPYKSPSAAHRDAYYRFVLNREAPDFGGLQAIRNAERASRENIRHASPAALRVQARAARAMAQ